MKMRKRMERMGLSREKDNDGTTDSSPANGDVTAPVRAARGGGPRDGLTLWRKNWPKNCPITGLKFGPKFILWWAKICGPETDPRMAQNMFQNMDIGSGFHNITWFRFP